MSKKIFFMLIMGIVILKLAGASFAMEGMCGMGGGVTEAAQISENVNNIICPVSDEKIVEGSKATYEYDGKIYNFCCASCIDEFKKDPENILKR